MANLRSLHALLAAGMTLASLGTHAQPARAAASFTIDLNGGVQVAAQRVARFVAVARNTGDQPGSALVRLGSPNCPSEQDECKIVNISHSGGVSGGSVVRLESGPAYSATFAAGAVLTVAMHVRADYCGDGVPHAVVGNASLKPLGGSAIDDTASVNMPCLPVLGGSDFVASLHDGGLQVLGPNREVPPGARIPVRIALANNTANPVHVAVRPDVQCAATLLRSEADPACRVAVHGDGAIILADHNFNAQAIGAGNIETITAIIDTRGSGEGASITGNFIVYVGGEGDPNEGSKLGRPGGYPVQTYTLNLPAIALRSNDLGDAPDSSNHTASSMLAYLPSTPGNFPTVFDPATGAAQGPLHRSPRLLHLGRRASHEVEADLGRDADIRNNLRPVLGVPNLDSGDDGVRIGALNFVNCATTTMKVSVFASHAIVQQFKGNALNAFPDDDDVFLNVWVDANRDGDWADATGCPTGGPAIEHIVRNMRIKGTNLQPGMNSVLAPTANVPWPVEEANRPSWLRVTLGDKPAPVALTFGGVNHGDGRGPTTGYGLGETEDYLWRPATARTTELNVKITGSVQPAQAVEPFIDQAGAVAAPDALYDKFVTQYIVDVTNSGDKPLKNVTLNLQPLGASLNGEIRVRQLALGDRDGALGWYGCITCTLLARGASADGFVFNLGRAVASGTTRFVVNVTRAVAAGVTEAANDAASAAADIAAGLAGEASGEEDNEEGGEDSGLNRSAAIVASAAATGTIGVEAFMRHFKPVISTPRAGTTSEVTGTVRGHGIPGTNIVGRLDGRPPFTVTVDAQGRFTHTHNTPLADGLHALSVRTVKGHLVSPAERVVFKVDADLLWSPMSMRVHRGNRVYAPVNALGRASENGWIVPLIHNQPHTITLKTNCDTAASVNWNLAGQSVNATLVGEYARLVLTPASAWPARGVITQTIACGADSNVTLGIYSSNPAGGLLGRAANDEALATGIKVLPLVYEGVGDQTDVYSHVASQLAGTCGSPLGAAWEMSEFDAITQFNCGNVSTNSWDDWHGLDPLLQGARYRFGLLKGDKQPSFTKPITISWETPVLYFYSVPEVNDEVVVMFRTGNAAASQVARLLPNVAGSSTHDIVWADGDTGTHERNALGETGLHLRVRPGAVVNLISSGDSLFGAPVLGWYGCITCTLARGANAQAEDASLGSALPAGGATSFKFDTTGLYTIASSDRPDDQITIEVVNQVFLPVLGR